ncbi:MAG: CBS domain-containing protein [Desulfobacteraceae bacterium]|nr:CBS domain-containing protein [Desulfobacteraceae bacterium]
MGLNDSIGAAVQKIGATVSLDDSLRDAIRRLAEASGATGLVVMGDGGRVVGIITARDLMRGIANQADLDGTRVSQYMSACELLGQRATKSPCAQVDQNESVAMTLAVMDQAGVDNLLVSGEGGEAIGTVSAKELLKLAIA